EKPAADLVRLAAPEQGGRVLDVGTGTGVAAAAAASVVLPGGLSVGVDLSKEMIRTGAAVRETVNFAAASGSDLPFATGVFDVVTANFVLSHFPRYETGLAEMTRVLRPGGRIALS